MSKQTDSESSKNIDPGEILQVGLTDERRPRCPLSSGNGQSPLPRKENTCSVVCIELERGLSAAEENCHAGVCAGDSFHMQNLRRTTGPRSVRCKRQ